MQGRADSLRAALLSFAGLAHQQVRDSFHP
jgi:hypothetical protein